MLRTTMRGPISGLSEKERTNLDEWCTCAEDVVYFLTKYAHIIDRNSGEKVKWEAWAYLVDMLRVIEASHEVVILKARQLGISWLIAGWALWKVIFHEATKGLLFSENEAKAFELLGKSKFIARNLPAFFQLTQKHPDNQGVLDFKIHDGVINGQPSTDSAGRGTDATFIIRDELRDHPYGKENFISVSPAIDAGGQLIDLSTIFKDDLENHFTERVNRALLGATSHEVLPSGVEVWTGGDSGATLIFVGWKLRPIRDRAMTLDEWYELRVIPKYSKYVREQEYPATLKDALSFSQARAFFDLEATEAMLLDTMRPIGQSEIDTFGGIVRVYKLPQIGRKYIAFTDPSSGQEDPFATVVMDAQSYEGIITAHGMVPADKCAEIHDSLVRACNNAFNSFEVNASAGGKFQDTIEKLKTPNVLPRRSPDGKIVKDRLGHYSTPTHRKNHLWGLEEAVRRRLIINHDQEATSEFKSFLIPEGEEPRATRGANDDFVIAWAGAWWYRKYVPVGGLTAYSAKYKV